MNIITKYIIFVVVTVIASFLFLKPIIYHDHEYRVVVVNASEMSIPSITITAAGMPPKTMGPIRAGYIQDYVFLPAQNGPLSYSMIQGKQTLNGTIKTELKKNETGDIFVVVGELFKVRILNEYDSAY